MSLRLARALALAAACLALLSCAQPAAASVDPQQLVLRPTDLRGGYAVERNEVHEPCDRGVGVGPTTPAFLGLWLRLRPDGCAVHMTRLWRLPGQAPAPREVRSLTLALPDAGTAAELLGYPRDFTVFAAGWFSREIDQIEPVPAIGDAAILVKASRASSAAVLWRSGAMVGAVIVTDRGDPAATAVELAAVQQARMLAPTPLPRDAFDDLEVPLDDPRLAGSVYWLGRTLPRAGGLPRLPLRWVEPPSRSQARAGLRTVLHYGPDATGSAIALVLLDPRTGRETIRRVQRHLRHERCTAAERVAVPHGSATIFTGAALCPRSADAAAFVRLPGVWVVVQPHACPDCRDAVIRAYRSRVGLRRIVRALRLRETPRPAPAP